MVVFSLETNRRFRHAIRLRPSAPDADWLGLTFRTSKTHLRFLDGRACFSDGRPLVLADDAQRRTFFALRRRENLESDFGYPSLDFTVSASDLVPPSPARS